MADVLAMIGDYPAFFERGLCSQADPEAWFPEKGGSTKHAKRVCNRCDVKPECRAYAIDNDERFGVWGGLSERERRRMKRRQAPPEAQTVGGTR